MMSPPIERLATALKLARGPEYSSAWGALRRYLNDLSDFEFRNEITLVTDREIFGYLYSVGLSSYRQMIVSIRKGELSK